MKIKVRYFAALRDQVRKSNEEVEVQGMPARQFVDLLISNYSITIASPMIRVSVNGAFVDDQYELHDGDDVVLIPPVAGG